MGGISISTVRTMIQVFTSNSLSRKHGSIAATSVVLISICAPMGVKYIIRSPIVQVEWVLIILIMAVRHSAVSVQLQLSRGAAVCVERLLTIAASVWVAVMVTIELHEVIIVVAVAVCVEMEIVHILQIETQIRGVLHAECQ